MTNSEENITVERLNLKPEMVENPAPEGRDFLRPLILFFLGGLIILFFLGEGLGELLATVLTVWISLFVIFAAIKKIKPLSHWKRIKNYKEKQNLPLKRTSDMIERGLKGFELSQMMIEKRIKKDFMEKIKEEENLSEKEIRELIQNPSELKKVIKDEELFNFITKNKTLQNLTDKNSDSIFPRAKNSYPDAEVLDEENKEESFERWIKKMIKRISNWES